MFDSHYCSLLTVTYLMQAFAVASVIGYKLRGGGRYNHLGLFLGIVVMSISTIICLVNSPGAGVVQGVGLVFVAACCGTGKIAAADPSGI